ncbi:MAG: PaaI family thioesterase [Polyangiales bacterium]
MSVTAEEFLKVLRDHMPDTHDLDLRIDHLAKGDAVVSLGHDDRRLRPGGTISGPTLFMLADLGLYLVTMSLVGLEPLAVTTDLTIHFLRKPEPRRLICRARVLKGGKRLVVGEAHLFSEGSEDPVAHAIGTYSVPPKSLP